MIKLIQGFNNRYNLKLGNRSFSPVMQLSIGLAMKYHEEVKKGFMNPLHLNFPDKQDSALWLSVALMRNFLLDDYVNQPINRIEDFGIKKGNKVELFNTVCIFEGLNNDKISLSFSDQKTPIEITNKLIRYVNPTNKKRVNKFKEFRNKRKAARSNRNAISKLLEPKEPILINEKILTSKVLIIAGRGNTGVFSDRLKKESLYETSLHDLFNCGENLIIKPSLEDYTFLGKVEDPSIETKFLKKFKQFIEELYEELPERENDIRLLESLVDIEIVSTKDFKQLFDDIVSECSPNSKYHKIRDEYYPGIKEQLPENLKSVIINDITQLDTYEGVIQEFLNRGIPVLVVSNRYIDDKKALSFFNNYFKTHSNDLRISWDKNKISAVEEISLEKHPLDYELWKKCLKFSKQKISIESTEPHPVDELLINLQRVISKLEGQERLKTAYWTYFSPLIYSFRNNDGWYSFHAELKSKFLSVFEEVRLTLDENISSLFFDIFEKLETNKESFKVLESESLLFGQQFDLNETQITFPCGDHNLVTASEIDSNLSRITFPGFPLNEPLNNNLLDIVSYYVIENIKILCWPKEGELTYNYISKRIKAGYYTDNIPDEWGFPEHLLLNDENDIRKLIDEILTIDSSTQHELNIEVEEEMLKTISEFKYSAYQNSHSTQSDSKVNCNIIDLHGNKFMFLPKTSSVLAKIETEGDSYEIRKVKFSELSQGDEIFQYELSRSRLRELSKEADYRDNVFGKLEIWKKSLKISWVEENCNIQTLLDRLKSVNSENNLSANPTYQNLRNWLFDDDMLSPEKENLKMILLADSDPNMISLFSDINEAYKKARGLSRKISSEIKKMIIKKLNSLELGEKSHFEIDVFGSPMIVDFSKIKGLQKTDFEVDYQHTRKFKQA